MHLSERAQLKQATELHVYDFDDTLFDSPLSPEGFDSREWWLSPESLSPPHVPAGKEGERKLPAVDAAKKSLSSGAYTVLVTGRVDVPGMRQRLLAILKALGLTMDAVVLKDGPGPTAAFKRRTVFALAGNMPNVKKVAMWDDMADNLKAVSVAVADKGLEFDSNLIKAKHQIEARLPDLEELVLALDARIRGRVAGETSDEMEEGRKPYPIGTIRDWKGGKVIKTANGWEPYGKQDSGAGKVAPEAGPKPTRRTQAFSPEKAAKALADFNANPASPDAQKAVRESLRALCGDFGMLDRDTLAVKPSPGASFSVIGGDYNKFGTFDESKGKSSIEGVHDWDGAIVVRPKYVKRAQEFLSGSEAAKQNHKLLKAMHVLVHEAVHGHSPIRQEDFKGRYRLLEEATTELAARKVSKDAFGMPWSSFASADKGDEEGKVGAYGEFCKSLYEGTKEALRRKGIEISPPEAWHDFLGEAAVEMRRRPPPHDKNKQEFLRRYASSLPIPPDKMKGNPDEVFKEVADAVWLSLKPASSKEKLLHAMTNAIKQGLLSPKDFEAKFDGPNIKSVELKPTGKKHPEVVAIISDLISKLNLAQEQWASYLSGKGSAVESLERLLQVLQEVDMALNATDSETGMIPRNDLPTAIAYARVLDVMGQLTPGALRDLALLQDDSTKAAEALNNAVAQYGLKVMPETPAIADGLVF